MNGSLLYIRPRHSDLATISITCKTLKMEIYVLVNNTQNSVACDWAFPAYMPKNTNSEFTLKQEKWAQHNTVLWYTKNHCKTVNICCTILYTYDWAFPAYMHIIEYQCHYLLELHRQSLFTFLEMDLSHDFASLFLGWTPSEYILKFHEYLCFPFLALRLRFKSWLSLGE